MAGRSAGRLAGRSAGRPAGRPGGARVVSGAEKKSFDRGGPVWPPRSNVTNDRLRGGLGGLCPPSQKPGGLGGSAPQPKFFEKTKKKSRYMSLFSGAIFLDLPLIFEIHGL